MKASEVIRVFKSSIAATRESGAEHIAISDLEAYVEQLDQKVQKSPDDVAAGEAALEAYRTDLNAWIANRQQSHEVNLELLRAVVTTGQSAVKSALIINGGASVALLAFIGRIWSTSQSTELVTPIALSLCLYAFGVLAAALAAGFTYFSQAGYAEDFGAASKVIGRVGHGLAIFGGLLAYVLFGIASYLAYVAFVQG